MKGWIPQILRWTAAMLTVAVAIALCVQCVDIYRTGAKEAAQSGQVLQSIFTPEKAAAHARPLIPLAAVWMVSLAAASLTPKTPPRRSPVKRAPPVPEMPHLRMVRILLGVLGAALVAAGVLNGGVYDVLVKAINICTECIGLG